MKLTLGLGLDVEKEVEKVDGWIEKADEAQRGIRGVVSEARNFWRKPEVKIGWGMLKRSFRKMAEKEKREQDNNV